MSVHQNAYSFAPRDDRGFYAFHEEAAAFEDVFRTKYRHWRGASGRAYVFSAYTPETCPAYENTVLIVADSGGGVRPLACVDLGALPEACLSALRRMFGARDVEFQIHVLADFKDDRLSMIEDLVLRAA